MFPSRVDDVHQDMMNDWNMNAQREFRFTERIRLEMPVDALNAMNRTVFDTPVTDPLSSDFGRMAAQTETSNRHIQIQTRIRF